MKKYYYFYKITNLINDHYYYGIHSTNDLDDNYMGSGTRLWKAYEKYGLDNFRKEIIKFFDNWDDLCSYERLMVTEELVKDSNCYNMVIGGQSPKEETYVLNGSIVSSKVLGDKNGMFNKKWITNGVDSLSVFQDEVEFYLKSGWKFGRTLKNADKIISNNKKSWKWIHNSEGKCIRVLIEEFDNYIQNGWKQGRIDRDKRKRIKDKTEEERIESLKKRNPKGYVVCKNTQTGEVKRISKNDIEYGNIWIPICKGIKNEKSYGKGKQMCVFPDGSKHWVDKNDERLLTGELKPFSTKGYTYSDVVKKKMSDIKCKGMKMWVHKVLDNGDYDIKFIFKTDFEQYHQNGYESGRK